MESAPPGNLPAPPARGASPVGRLRLRIVAVCAGLLALLIAGAVLGGALLRSWDLEQAQSDLQRLAVLGAERTALGVNAADFVLRSFQTFAVQGEGEWDPRKLTPHLTRLVHTLLGVQAVTIFDRQGVARASSSESDRGSIAAHSDYFLSHTRRPEDFLYVGPWPVGPEISGAGAVLSRRLVDAHGTFVGVIAIRTDPAYGQSVFERSRPGPDMRVRLLHLDGRELASLGPIAANLHPTPTAGSTEGTAIADPNPVRMYAHSPVPGYPLTLEITRSRDIALAKWRHTAFVLATGTFIVSAVIVALTGLLWRSLAQVAHAADALSENRSLLQLVLDSIPYTVLLRDRDARILLANAEACRLMNVDPATVLNAPQGAFVEDQEELGAMLATDGEVLKSGQGVDFTIERDLPGGKRPFRVKKVPVRDAAGNASRVLIVAEDISGQQDTMRKLRESEGLLQLVFDTIPYSLIAKDLETRVIVANKAAGANTLGDSRLLLGMKITDIPMPAEERETIAENDARAIAGESIAFEMIRTGRTGVRRLHVTKVPIRDTAGRITGVLSLSEDITGRHLSYQLMQESKALLQTTLDTLPQGVHVKDLDGRIRLVNTTFSRNWKIPPEALIGGRIEDGLPWDRIPQRDKDTMTAADARVMQGETVEYESERTNALGLAWVRTIKAPVRDAHGTVTGILTISENISARRAAEADLQRHRLLLQTMFDTIPMAIYVLDAQGNFMLTNRTFQKNWGISAAESAGFSLEEAGRRAGVPRSETDEIRKLNARVLQGEIVEGEVLLTMPAGQRWLRSFKGALRTDSGEFQGLLTVFEDITERKNADRELAESRLLLQTVFDTIPHHVFVKDAQRCFLIINRAMAEAFEIEPKDIIGKTHLAPFLANFRESVELEDREVLEHGRTTTRTFARPMPGGTVRHFYVTKGPMRNADGTIVGLAGIADDVTERVLAEEHRLQLEAQLQQAQKMELVGRLAASVAHDFNNLLTPIQGHAELMLTDSATREQRESLEVILLASERAAELTRSLLSFGSKQVLHRNPVQLDQELRAFLPILKRLLGSSVQVRMTVSSELGLILADSSQMQQVFLNLAVNARDAMPGGGTLTIEMANTVVDEHVVGLHTGLPPGPYVVVAVSDTGHGMDARTQARIFEPFFSTKGPGKGTGLGLSIVQDIVRQHGGHVSVYSAPDRGTTFRVYLPRIQGESSEAAESATQVPVPRGSETVVVVDDESLVRDLVGAVLRSCGYRVVELTTAQEVLRYAEQHPDRFDLLVSDIIMPGMSGIELAAKLAENLAGTKVLFMSGHSRHVLEDLGFRMPAGHFVSKPFTLEHLARTVREVLDA